MLFDTLETKDDIIDRLIEQRGCMEEVEIDFSTGTVEVKGSILFPNTKIDEDGDEDFDYEEYKECKRSDKADEYYNNSLSMFSEIKNSGADSPKQDFYNKVIGNINNFVKALYVEPHWQQQELLDAYEDKKSNIAIRSGQGPGKCPTKHNIIWDKNLGRITVGEAEGKSLTLLSMDDNKKMVWKNATCTKNEVKNCHKISVESGNELEISSDHKVFTDKGWVEAGKVTKDMLMAVPREMNILEDDNTITTDEAVLLAYMVADGGTTTASATFSQEDNSTLDNLKRIVDSLGGKVRHRSRYDYGVSGITPWMRKHKLIGKKATEKTVPAAIYTNGERAITAFLRAFWECDGYVGKDGYGTTLANKRLVEDIQALLQSIGIMSNVKYKQVKFKEKKFDSWRLEVAGARNLNIWMDKIGHIDRKPLNEDLLHKKPNSNMDIVPIKEEQGREIAEEMGTNPTGLRKYNFRGRKSSNMNRSTLERFVKDTGYDGKYTELAESEIRWVRILDVTDIGDQQTYDVSVEDTHNFVCSNLVVHNTFASCVVWLHWLMSNPYGLLVVTAPTMRQCKDVWLAQARQLIQNAHPWIKEAFEFTNTGIKMFGNKASDWGCYLATANKAENFQGIHRERLGIHCEEASGLERQILETIQGTLNNADGKYLWIQIGNPNTRDCGFYDCFYGHASVWHCIHWNGEETPTTKFIDPARRNKEVADEHGKDSDVYRVRVLGEFPSKDPSTMISLEELMACTKADALKNATKFNMILKAKGELWKHIGIDLARFGGDENGITAFEGNIQRMDIEAYSRTDPNDAIDRAVIIQEEILDWRADEALFIVDTSGMGEAAVGRLGQKKRLGKQVHEFYSQNCAADSSKYYNKISEAWCLFAKAVRKKEVFLKYDKKTFDQLAGRRYRIDDKTGTIRIESKDEYKRRHTGGDEGALGKSPDRADTTVMGYYPPAEVSTRIAAREA